MTRRLATKRARALRSEQTRAEAHLWRALRNRGLGGWKWRRQVPCGPFILDFLCSEARLVVELDGGQHTETEAYDIRRTRHLETLGLRVLRFWNSFVLTSRADVCDTILAACQGELDPDELVVAPPGASGSAALSPALRASSPASGRG